jgi:hypothetical protein
MTSGPNHNEPGPCVVGCPECADDFEAIGGSGEGVRTGGAEWEYERHHAGFLDRLANSVLAVNAVADWLRGRGRKVVVPELKKAPTRSQFRRYSDSGDMLVGEPAKKYEVKGLSRTFTGRDDWPFGEHFIVDSIYNFDGKGECPAGYFVVSADHRAFAYVDVGSTRRAWTRRTRRDRLLEGEEREYYFCPIELVRFVLMEGGTVNEQAKGGRT